MNIGDVLVALGEFVKELRALPPQATIYEREKMVQQFVDRVGQLLLEGHLQDCFDRYRAPRVIQCKGCGQRMICHRNEDTRHLKTHYGVVRIKSPYYYCEACDRGVRPVDEPMGLLERQQISPALEEDVVLLGCHHDYRQAEDLLRRLLRVEVSAKEIEWLTEKRGEEVLGQPPEGEPEAMPSQGEVVYVQEDGSHLRTRTEGWRECRLVMTFGASAIVEGEERSEIVHKKLLAQIESSLAFGKRVGALLTRAGVIEAPTVVWLGDGASWIWEHQQWYCPRAVTILDFYHASEHLWQVAHTRFGLDDPQGKQWQDQKEEQLKNGAVEQIIAELEALQGKGAKTAWAEAEYFKKHREKMRYDVYRKLGYYIGSGAVESANAGAVQRRMKQPGMRWSVKDANKVLAIRMAYLSEDWDKINWANKKAA
jgi:hypothetical protein